MAVKAGYMNYQPAPGAQQPQKYPVPPGPNYQYYGEQPGFNYDPYTDTFYPDAKKQEEFYDESGIKKKDKTPTLTDAILPVAGAAFAYEAAKGFGNNPTGWVGGIKDGVSNVYDAVTGGTTAATPATAAAPASAASSAPTIAAQAAPASAAAAAPFSGFTAPASAEASFGGLSIPTTGAETAATYAAPSAGNTFGVLGGLGSTIGLAGQAYQYGSEGIKAYNELKDSKTSAQGGIRAALLAGGPFSAWATPVVDFLGIKSGKHKDQYGRDAINKRLQEAGIIDDKYQLQNADGSAWDFGLDGGARLEGGHLDGKRQRFDIDFNDQRAVSLIPGLDALSTVLAGGDKKLVSDLTGKFANAATASGDPTQNVMSYYQKAGLDHSKVYNAIDQMSRPGPDGQAPQISKEESDRLKNGLDSFFGVGAYANGAKPIAPPMPTPEVAPITAPQAAHVQAPSAAPAPQAQVAEAPFSMPSRNPALTPEQEIQVKQKLGGGSSSGGQPIDTTGAQNAMYTPPPGTTVQNVAQQTAPPFAFKGRQRVSPGVWQDEKGQYQSKTGARGQ